ncbi:hypothetical protein GGF42_002400, partial [Coemansia sp. RSA 2424]
RYEMFAQNMQQSRGFGAFKFPKGGVAESSRDAQGDAAGAAAAASGNQFTESNQDDDLYD